VLLHAEAVGVGAIWSVERLLESGRKILIEVGDFPPHLFARLSSRRPT
jgi:hypothetical protein